MIKLKYVEGDQKRILSAVKKLEETDGIKIFVYYSQLLWLTRSRPCKENLDINGIRAYQLWTNRSYYNIYTSMILKGLHCPFKISRPGEKMAQTSSLKKQPQHITRSVTML